MISYERYKRTLAHTDLIIKHVKSNMNTNLSSYCAFPLIENEIRNSTSIVNYFAEQSFKSKNLLGFTHYNRFGMSLVISKDIINIGRRNFTLLHELGHVLLHGTRLRDELITDSTLKSKDKYETEANIFASNVLLPSDVLESQLKEGFSYKKICKTCGISRNALKWRIVSLLHDYYFINRNQSIELAQRYVNDNPRFKSDVLIKIIKSTNGMTFPPTEIFSEQNRYNKNKDILSSKFGIHVLKYKDHSDFYTETVL